MSFRHLALSAAAALAALVLAAAGPVQPGSAPTGLWRNPKGTVVVRASACGARLCGTVVWATRQAVADARDGGDEDLVGTELLRDYRQDRPGHWTGVVFVPDMGRTFYSTIEQKGPNRIEVAGCILHGLICKRQQWIRA